MWYVPGGQEYNLYDVLVSTVTLIRYSKRSRMTLKQSIIPDNCIPTSVCLLSYSSDVDNVPILIEYQAEFLTPTGYRNVNSDGICRNDIVLHCPKEFQPAGDRFSIINIPSDIDTMLVIEGDNGGMFNNR